MKSPKLLPNPGVAILLVVLTAGCSRQPSPVAFHAKSNRVDHSDSSWSEPIRVKAGQTIEVAYDLTLTEGTWALWLTREDETDPRYFYSKYDRSYKGKIKYSVSRTGKFVLRIKSEDFTGSYDVTMRVIK